MLTSICVCGDCGGPIVVITARKGGYYGCQNSYRKHECENRKLIFWKKFELPILEWIIDQIKSDEVCQIIASRYNAFRKVRSQGTHEDLDVAERKLAEAVTSIDNIIRAIERGTASDALMARLASLETEKGLLDEKTKFLRGVEQSEVYVTPTAIKRRFAQMPKLLQESEPFEVNRAIKPLVGKAGITLVKRPDENDKKKVVYWAVGVLNISKAMSLVDQTGTMGAGGIGLEVPLELKLD